MATEYPVIMTVKLRPVGRPWIRIGLDGHTQEKQLVTETTFEWEFNATDQVCFTLEHFDKDDIDPTTAVEIVSIGFYGIEDPKFVWAGTYFPNYPKTWYAEQNPAPSEILPGQAYLGWNGVYSLTFDVPVFTWIHKTLNLGWIYQ